MIATQAFRLAFASVLVFCFSAQLKAAEPKVGPAEMVRDLDFITSVFKNQYAPREWKAKHLGWDMDKAFADAKLKVASGMSVLEYRKTLRKLLRSANDYHVGVSFHSTESANLPFEVRSAVVEGKRIYRLVRIERAQLPQSSFPFSEGDELVSLGGRPTQEVIDELIEQNSMGTVLTDQMRAEVILTSRKGASAMTVPKGPVMVEIKPKDGSPSKSRQLIWNHTREQIQAAPMPQTLMTLDNSLKSLDIKAEAADAHIFARERAEDPANHFAVGSKKSFIPQLGEKIWEAPADAAFDAYVFRAVNGKLIGYIRINAYDGDASKATAFGEVLTYFNKATDGLIIDQINNPGGYIFYMYGLASMLTDRPLTVPRHKMSVDQSDVAEAISTLAQLNTITDDASAKALAGESLRGYSVDYQAAKIFADYSQFIIDQWNEGKTLTDPYFLIVDQINPHPTVNYTKPILLLVNAMDYSCGDFFPAIMQDNKRVTILGTRTAGAGGYVKTISHPNQFGTAAFRFTASIAERADKNPIENLGVEPDIKVEITDRDLQEGFINYKEAILKAAQDLIK